MQSSEYPNSPNGRFFVIEGTDGSGKGTQFKVIAQKLRDNGYQVELFDFPQYDQESSYFVRNYLNGMYGTAEEVGPYTASLFYAIDRYQAAPKIKQALQQGKIVLANRFVASNLGHQGTKFNNSQDRRKYYLWLDKLEHDTMHIPRPTKNFVLKVPANIAQKLVDKKDARQYTDKKRDLHEADINHLSKAVEVYDELCNLFPKEFTKLECTKDGNLKEINVISNMLWENIMPLLPKNSSNKNDYASSAHTYTKNGAKAITPAGAQKLSQYISDTNGDVYAFNSELDQVTVAAAMARLSRRGDDMRVTLLDEFIDKDGKDEGLIQRVVTAYGDDSVQQLVGLHLVVENASNLLTKQIEWGRLAAYLEQSTRYIYYDQKDSEGKYKYYVPSNIDGVIKEQYIKTMDELFDNYSAVVHRLTDYLKKTNSTPKDQRDVAWNSAIRAQACDAARNVLPVATKSTVGIFGSGQAIESLIMRLLAEESLEARKCGESILKEARKITPAFLERADKPERGGATIAYKANTRQNVNKLANKLMPHIYSNQQLPVTLTNYYPKNELDTVAYMLYEHSNLSESEIKDIASKMPYNDKLDVFNAYIGDRLNRRHRPGRALERAVYSWDIVCDYGIFRDLQRHRIVDDLFWQELTPRYGYDVPELIEQAGLTDEFVNSFDLSLKLNSLLTDNGLNTEAQYATLMGHKMRWKVTMNAREAFHFIELRTSPQGHPGYRQLVKQMHDALSEVHPLIAGAMKFVNKDEDPELTRLAAERYTQYKLDKLS